jgi:hypothetical protein
MIKISARGIEEFNAFLKDLPKGTIKVGLAALADWMIGAPGRALRHMEPYKYVSRKRAYGQTFQSEKQRRWFWANGGPDMIGNNRTGATANAWTSKATNSGYGVTLENPSEGAKHIWGDDTQAAQPAAVGHRTAGEKIKSNTKAAIRHMLAAVRAFLGKKG